MLLDYIWLYRFGLAATAAVIVELDWYYNDYYLISEWI